MRLFGLSSLVVLSLMDWVFGFASLASLIGGQMVPGR